MANPALPLPEVLVRAEYALKLAEKRLASVEARYAKLVKIKTAAKALVRKRTAQVAKAAKALAKSKAQAK